jgi:type I restriction enzyme R subunit
VRVERQFINVCLAYSVAGQDWVQLQYGKPYRQFQALRKKTVGDYFFKETEDLVEKLCDDF